MSLSIALVLFDLLAILFHVHEVTPWSFQTMEEPLTTTRVNRDSTTTFLCQADVPLIKCQVKALPRHKRTTLLIDLSLGTSSGQIHGGDDIAVTYNGTGLDHGQCGATFSGALEPWMHYACRGADASGEWQEMDFAAVRTSIVLAASIIPRQVIVKVGEELSVVLKTAAPLYDCTVVVIGGDGYVNFFDDIEKTSHNGRYRYYGAGLSHGECGFTVVSVSDAENGPVVFVGQVSDYIPALRFANVIVVSPPAETHLKVNKLKYSVGDTLTATCSSLLSRPVANLTWTLDDRIIRQDWIDDEFQEDAWSWPWDKKNITQRMSLILEEEHFGKELECIINNLDITKNQTQLHYLITNTSSVAHSNFWLLGLIAISIIVNFNSVEL